MEEQRITVSFVSAGQRWAASRVLKRAAAHGKLCLGVGRVRGVQTQQVGDAARCECFHALVLCLQEGWADELLLYRIEAARVDEVLVERGELLVEGLRGRHGRGRTAADVHLSVGRRIESIIVNVSPPIPTHLQPLEELSRGYAFGEWLLELEPLLRWQTGHIGTVTLSLPSFLPSFFLILV